MIQLIGGIFCKNEVKELTELYSKFHEKCEEVKKIISKEHSNYDYERANECDNWYLEKQKDGTYKVSGQGWDNGGYCIFCEFPINLLTMTNEELDEMVEKDIDEYIEKKKREEKEYKEKMEAAKRKREISELKRLQEKYKDEVI